MVIKPSPKIALVYYGAALTTLYLSLWQFKRLRWKEQLIKERKRTIFSAPKKLDDADLNGETPFVPVSLEGIFDYSSEKLLGLRSQPYDTETKQKIGFYVLTPLVMADRNTEKSAANKVLVNRGWIAMDEYDRFKEQTNGDIEKCKVIGILNEYDEMSRRSVTPYNKDVLTNLNKTEINKILKTEQNGCKVVDATLITGETYNDKDIFPKNIASFLQFRITPEKHKEYGIFWGAMSVIATVIGFKFSGLKMPLSPSHKR